MLRRIAASGLLLLVMPSVAFAAGVQDAHEEFVTATVTAVLRERTEDTPVGAMTVQELRLRASDGVTVTADTASLPHPESLRLGVGDRVVLARLSKADGTTAYQIRELYRLPSLLWLTLGFFLLAVLLGGLTGIRSALGLVISVLILAGFVLPRIANGWPPLAVCVAGAAAIAVISLTLAHGFNRRTAVALLSTLLTLGIASVLAELFVRTSWLFGMGSEESVFLQSGQLAGVDLRGLLLGGIVLGCLGVLDDVTTAQTATVDELKRANRSLTPAQLRAAGLSVGREHIASLVNTLALAYAGTSLPLLLLFATAPDIPLWVTLNGEFIAEELVRTLVGSCTLLLAVPISTALASVLVHPAPGSAGGHAHHH